MSSITTAQEMKHIDLGLSVEWAECNLGAKDCWETGNYYAWGEASIKDSYDYDKYKWFAGQDTTFLQGYFFPLYSKYCIDGSSMNKRNVVIDGKKVLETEDDAAIATLGGRWRMPTNDEFQELISNCDFVWTQKNHIYGYRINSKTTGNSIFIPVTGFRVTTKIGGNEFGYYWTKNLSYENLSADCFMIDESEYKIIGRGRFLGNVIRPVWDSNE